MRIVPKRLKTERNPAGKIRRKLPPSSARKGKTVPKYWTVATDMIAKINQGLYKDGEKIESMRVLADRYAVGVQVIQLAMAGLENLGYVRSEAKCGVFVTRSGEAGPYFRLGIFINDYNLTREGLLLQNLGEEIEKAEYTPVAGCNHDEPYSFESWLESRKLDGVFLSGIVDENLTQTAIRKRIPYLVLGNYDIAPSHPQILRDVRGDSRRFFRRALKKYAGKRISFLFGAENSRADRERREALIEVLRELNGTVDETLLPHCEGDGYEQVSRIIGGGLADVLMTTGSPLRGYFKYCTLHRTTARPFTAVDLARMKLLPEYRPFVDATIHLPSLELDMEKAVRQMLRMVEERYSCELREKK